MQRSAWLGDSNEDYNSCLTTGEPLIQSMDPNADPDYIPPFRMPRPKMSAYEVWQLNKERRALRKVLMDRWEATAQQTGTGRPIDAIICPVAPYPAVPHGQMKRVRYQLYTPKH